LRIATAAAVALVPVAAAAVAIAPVAAAAVALAAEEPGGGGAGRSPGAGLLPSPEVQDPALALLVGIIRKDCYGAWPRAELERELRGNPRKTRVPFESLSEFRRRAGASGRSVATVNVILARAGAVRIPYDILGYHPGKLRLSGELELVEWRLGSIRYGVRERGGRDGPFEDLEDVTVWGVRRGRARMDVDGWLDALMGSRLDDTEIVGFALFRHRGRSVAMALGYNDHGRGYSGAFDLTEDRILFPHPPEFQAAGAMLRARLERLMGTTRRPTIGG
jgi:hypothetical protein